MNEKGFSLIEMLVSISIVFMVSALIIPSFMSILIERKNLALRNEGNIFIQEQVFAYYYAPSKIKTEEVREGTVFKVQTGKKNICVTWENRKQKEEKTCYELFK